MIFFFFLKSNHLTLGLSQAKKYKIKTLRGGEGNGALTCSPGISPGPGIWNGRGHGLGRREGKAPGTCASAAGWGPPQGGQTRPVGTRGERPVTHGSLRHPPAPADAGLSGPTQVPSGDGSTHTDRARRLQPALLQREEDCVLRRDRKSCKQPGCTHPHVQALLSPRDSRPVLGTGPEKALVVCGRDQEEHKDSSRRPQLAPALPRPANTERLRQGRQGPPTLHLTPPPACDEMINSARALSPRAPGPSLRT